MCVIVHYNCESCEVGRYPNHLVLALVFYSVKPFWLRVKNKL